MFSTQKAKKTRTHTLTQCHKTFLSHFFFLFPLTLTFLYLSSFSASPLRFSLLLLFVFPLVILPNPSTNPTMEIKVWTYGADLHCHPAPPTSWASSPSAARSPLTWRSSADLWSWKRALTWRRLKSRKTELEATWIVSKFWGLL